MLTCRMSDGELPDSNTRPTALATLVGYQQASNVFGSESERLRRWNWGSQLSSMGEYLLKALHPKSNEFQQLVTSHVDEQGSSNTDGN